MTVPRPTITCEQLSAIWREIHRTHALYCADWPLRVARIVKRAMPTPATVDDIHTMLLASYYDERERGLRNRSQEESTQ